VREPTLGKFHVQVFYVAAQVPQDALLLEAADFFVDQINLAELDEHRAELRSVPPLNFALAAGRALGCHQFKFSRDRD
jgi:hypothetical protein